MQNNNPPKRKPGPPKRLAQIQWQKFTMLIPEQQHAWLSEQGEIANQIRKMIDYMMQHPEVYAQVRDQAA